MAPQTQMPAMPAVPAIPATQKPSVPGGALEDYQMQLILLEQQNKRRLMLARQEQNAGNDQSIAVEKVSQKPNSSTQSTALDDYQRQLMLLEQQNKNRLAMARQEQDAVGQQMKAKAEAKTLSPSSRLQAPLMPSILNSKVSKLNQEAILQNPINYCAVPPTITAPNVDAAAIHRAPTQQRSTRVNPAFQEVCAGKIPDVFHMFQDDIFDYRRSEDENNQALDNAVKGVNWIMAHPYTDAGIEYETVQLQHMVKSLRTLLEPIPILSDMQTMRQYRMPHEGGSYRQSAYDYYAPYYNAQALNIDNTQNTAPPVPARPVQHHSHGAFAEQAQDFRSTDPDSVPDMHTAFEFPDVPITQPTTIQPSQVSQPIIDRCIETLLEMGYEPRSRVEAIAASADGDFHTAMDLLEEDDRAKNRIRKGKDKADPNADLSVPGGWGPWDGWDVGNFEEHAEDSGVEGLD